MMHLCDIHESAEDFVFVGSCEWGRGRQRAFRRSSREQAVEGVHLGRVDALRSCKQEFGVSLGDEEELIAGSTCPLEDQFPVLVTEVLSCRGGPPGIILFNEEAEPDVPGRFWTHLWLYQTDVPIQRLCGWLCRALASPRAIS